MMWNRITKATLILLTFAVVCFAQEVLPGKKYEEDSTTINEELRKIRDSVDNALKTIENRTSDPENPKNGQIWLRTDL